MRDADDLRALLVACQDGDRPSRDRMVELSMPLVRSLARRYANRGEQTEDLVQVGVVGLLKAIDRFDPARGDFFGFAVPTITGEIRHHLRDLAALIRPPRALAEPDPGLGTPLSLSSEGVTGRRIDAALATERAYEPCDARLLLVVAFRTLEERDRRILHLRFFAGLNQCEIARELGLSQVQVSRRIRASLERMRAVLVVGERAVTREHTSRT